MNKKHIHISLIFTLAIAIPLSSVAENSKPSLKALEEFIKSLPKDNGELQIGQMRNEHIIIESAQIQVLPNTDDSTRGLVTLRCEEEGCQINQINYGPETAIYNTKNQPTSSESLLTYTGKNAAIWIKRGDTIAETIRIYP